MKWQEDVEGDRQPERIQEGVGPSTKTSEDEVRPCATRGLQAPPSWSTALNLQPREAGNGGIPTPTTGSGRNDPGP